MLRKTRRTTEQVAAYQKAWRLAHPDYGPAYHRIWQREHIAHVLAYQADRRQRAKASRDLATASSR